MATALLPFARGFEEIEAVSVVDILRRGGVRVVTASIGDDLQVQGAHGMTVTADALLDDLDDDDFDAIVLPGGGEGTENLAACETLRAMLARQIESRRLVAAICAAPTILVRHELLPIGVHVTCYPSLQADLDRPWSPAPVVEEGPFITGQAPGSAMLFGLVVLKALAGERVAAKVASGMVTDVLG